jgi:hypothetical protein
VISIEIRNGIATVTSKPYSAKAVDVIKSVRGKRWDAAHKRWIIPLPKLQQTVERLVRTGEYVQVNGKEWEGTLETQKLMADRQAAELEAELQSNPLAPLFRQLPAPLREPVHEALSKLLTPAAGGDVQWLVWLDQAHSACQDNGDHGLVKAGRP